MTDLKEHLESQANIVRTEASKILNSMRCDRCGSSFSSHYYRSNKTDEIFCNLCETQKDWEE